MSLLIAVASTGAVVPKLDSSEVFSTYLYPGNSSTQTITNGIDLAGKGGMVWIKGRPNAGYSHRLFDTTRGANKSLATNLTTNQSTETNAINSFNSNGYSLGSDGNGEVNFSGSTYASWTFRNADKFFKTTTKVHTTGTASTVDLANLGTVGMVEVKSTIGTSNWFTYHRSATSGKLLYLNLTNAETTDASISVSGTTLTIASAMPSDTYVVYAYAHDISADGIIQCGSYAGNGTSQDINLGWEPQYILVKNSSNDAGWWIEDNMRGMPVGSGDKALLQPNTTGAELLSSTYVEPIANGFKLPSTSLNTSGQTYIYMAIRRPMKVPTSGTEVYSAVAYIGGNGVTKKITTPFPVDMEIIKIRNDATRNPLLQDRLRGKVALATSSIDAEINYADNVANFDYSDGVLLPIGSGTNEINGASTSTYVGHFFKRAKGFFDIVCYTGTGAIRTVAHNLSVAPEFMIIKVRNGSGYDWMVYHTGLNNGIAPESWWTKLNGNIINYSSSLQWNNTQPTSTVFSLGIGSNVNRMDGTLIGEYVAYLFATLANVSKCFSYTGNGSSLNVECGFSTGARFVLCKRIDSTGDWFLFDSVRGIVAANDPHLSLNTTAAEVTTDDSIDPYSNGFTVNQNATTNLNVNGGTYIGLAIA